MEVLAESGYARTSFAKIAEQAGISSTRLISYHFTGKEELMRAVAQQAKEAAVEFIGPRIRYENGHRGMLATYITANLAFMRERSPQLRALIELDRNAQAAIGEPFLPDRQDDPLTLLEEGLRDGQRAGEFRDFDAHVMAVTLRAAIDTIAVRYAADPGTDLDAYAAELVELFDRATRNEKP